MTYTSYEFLTWQFIAFYIQILKKIETKFEG